MARVKQLPVRFSAQGGDSLKALMRSIGMEGREAMQGIGASASGAASAGLDRMSAAAMSAQSQLDQIAAKAAGTAAAMRNPLQAQINSLTGAFDSGNRASQTYFADQMRHLDNLRAKYNPMFSVIQRYKQEVAEIRQANMMQAISEDEKAAAISRARQAALADIAVIKNRTTAIVQQSAATRMGTFRMQQMFFQMNDIGVSLAGGMNPFIVLAQQGTQIAQIYGFGQGGVNGAFRDMGKMIRRIPGWFKLVAAASAVVFGGLTKEINETTDVSVSMGDTIRAVFQVIGRGIKQALKPVIDWISPYFAMAWDKVVSGTKIVINGIVNGIRIAIEGVRTAVDIIPNLFQKAWEMAKMYVFHSLADMIGGVQSFLQSVADGLNSLFPGANLSIGEGLGSVVGDMNKRGNDAAVRAQGIDTTGFAGFRERAAEIWNQDPAGEVFQMIRDQAIKNARDRAKKDDKGGGGGSESDQVAKLIEQLQRELAVLRETDPVKQRMIELSEQMKGATEAEVQQIANLVVEQDRAKNGWEAVGRSLMEYAEEAKRIGDDIGESLVGAFRSAEDAVAEVVKTGKLNFSDLVSSILADMAKLATQHFITGPLASIFGDILGGIDFGGFDSHEGGGRTRFGPRTGGLDGKGGYLAMVHPQERIVDEYQGQRAQHRESGPVVINFNGVRDAESFRQSRAQVAADVQRAVAMGRRTM